MPDDLDAKELKANLAADYDAAAAAYDEYWGPAIAPLAVAFLQNLPLPDAQAILDVGAGSGSTLRYLLRATDATVVGIDRSGGMLSRAPAAALRAVMDAERLGFREGSFDVAVAMFVLFHLPDPLAGLREIRRVLKDGATVAITTWGDDDPGFRALDVIDEVLDRHGAAEGRALYARYELSDTPDKCGLLMEKSGFEVCAIRAERMSHEWTIDDLIGYRTQLGYGRVRWESLDADARPGALEEVRAALAELAPDEMTERDEVIYSIGRAVRPRIMQRQGGSSGAAGA